MLVDAESMRATSKYIIPTLLYLIDSWIRKTLFIRIQPRIAGCDVSIGRCLPCILWSS